jgi:hypothetical protein
MVAHVAEGVMLIVRVMKKSVSSRGLVLEPVRDHVSDLSRASLSQLARRSVKDVCFCMSAPFLLGRKVPTGNGD